MHKADVRLAHPHRASPPGPEALRRNTSFRRNALDHVGDRRGTLRFHSWRAIDGINDLFAPAISHGDCKSRRIILRGCRSPVRGHGHCVQSRFSARTETRERQPAAEGASAQHQDHDLHLIKPARQSGFIFFLDDLVRHALDGRLGLNGNFKVKFNSRYT